MNVRELKEQGYVLYAIAYRELMRGQWTGNIVHTYARDQNDARVSFWKGRMHRRHLFQVDAVAPAVGYFSEDGGQTLTTE